ncbi:MAG TPA: AsmA-like C-terminal region-containing protein [Phycisphaerae bacterium]|nr:AsmA-like C-terminal region-containing protein [Phycisphaerae bacterium]
MANYPRASPAQWWKTTAIGVPHRSPHAMFVGRFRRWTTTLMLLVLAVLVGGVWFMVSPSRLSTMAGILLSHVLGGDVTITSSHLSWAGTLQLTGVKLGARAGTGPGATLFSADQVEVSFKWLGLLSGRLEATEIDADQPVLNLVQNVDTNQWNYVAFLHNRQPASPAGGGNDQPPAFQTGGENEEPTDLPTINIRNAEVRWGRIENGIYTSEGVSQVNAQLGPSLLPTSTYVMEIEQETENGTPGIILHGLWNVPEREFSAQMSDLEFNESLRRSLPGQIQRWWDQLHLKGDIQRIGFYINSTQGIELTASLHDVSMQLTVPSNKVGPQIVPITGLSGDVLAGSSQFVINNLSGVVMNSRFVVPKAEFDGYEPGDPFDVTVDMPGLYIDPHYPALFSTEKFPVAMALIYRLRPSGLVDLSVNASRQANSPVTVNGEIVCRDLQARYVHFPYPFEHAQGVIRFNNHQIEFVNTHAVAETYPITLNGIVGINSQNTQVDLTIASEKCFFDKRLEECMPAELIPIWDKFDPVGYGRFICHVTRAQGDSDKPDFAVDILPMDVTGRYADFPYPLQHVHGEIYFTEHQTRIVNLTSPVDGGKGSIVFNGTVNYSPDEVNDMQPFVHVVATNIPVDQTLWDSLPDSYNRRLHPMNLVSGTMAMDAMITRGPEDSPKVDGTLTLTGGTLKPDLLPWPITNANMAARLSYQNVDLLHLTGDAGPDQKGTFTVTGNIFMPETGPSVINAKGVWQNIQVDANAPASLPEQWRKIWDKWNPSGTLNGSLAIVLSLWESEDTGVTTSVFNSLSINLEPQKMRLAPAFLPDPISNIQGDVNVTPKTIELKDLSAAAGPINLTLNGDYGVVNSEYNLSLMAQAPKLPDEWIKVLPGSAAPIVAEFEPQGAWLVDLGKLQYSKDNGQPNWRFTGSVVLDNMKFQKTVRASIKHATVTIAGNWASGDQVPDMAGEFSLTGLTWAGKTVDPASGAISADAIKKTIDIEPISGTIAGGTINGQVNISFEPQPAYAAAFTMKDAQLADLLNSSATTTPADQQINSGTVEAELSMTQKFSDPTTRTGTGELVVTNAKIYNVPLAMGLLQIGTLRLPISDAFNYALINYELSNDVVTFNSIQLNSPGVDLVGSGNVDLSSGMLNLNMATQTPNGPGIPVLGDIVDFLQQQLLELRIRGTIDDPVIVPIPLHMVTFPLDLLVP